MRPRSTTRTLSRNALAHLLMFAAVMLWGVMFVVVKESLASIRPQWFNALRMMLGFACLAIVYRRQWRLLTRQSWIFGAAGGASMAAGFYFQTQGLLSTTATNSALLTALVVIFVPILASLPGLHSPGGSLPQRSVPQRCVWIGALLAFWGVALLTTPAHTPWLQLLHSLNHGDVLSLCCALGFSLQIIALEIGSRRVRFQQLALLQVGFATLILTLTACLTEPLPAGTLAYLSPAALFTHPHLLLAIAVAGILATAVAFSIQTWAQQIIPATSIAVIATLEPVFAWLTAFFVLRESFELRRGLGAVLVLTGILTTEILPRWLRRFQPGESTKQK